MIKQKETEKYKRLSIKCAAVLEEDSKIIVSQIELLQTFKEHIDELIRINNELVQLIEKE